MHLFKPGAHFSRLRDARIVGLKISAGSSRSTTGAAVQNQFVPERAFVARNHGDDAPVVYLLLPETAVAPLFVIDLDASRFVSAAMMPESTSPVFPAHRHLLPSRDADVFIRSSNMLYADRHRVEALPLPYGFQHHRRAYAEGCIRR